MDAIEKSIKFSRNNDVKIALTFSDLSMVKYFRDNFDKILDEKIDLLFCNKEEAETFTGEKDFKKCCDKMLTYSDLVVITMGSEGSVILSKSNNLIKISEPNKKQKKLLLPARGPPNMGKRRLSASEGPRTWENVDSELSAALKRHLADVPARAYADKTPYKVVDSINT